jgi:hypothetical protein
MRHCRVLSCSRDLDGSCSLYEIEMHAVHLYFGFMSMMQKSRSKRVCVLAYVNVGKAL